MTVGEALLGMTVGEALLGMTVGEALLGMTVGEGAPRMPDAECPRLPPPGFFGVRASE